MVKSRGFAAVTVVILLMIVALVVYAVVTYPRNTLTIQVSFTIGADVVTKEFNQPLLDNMVQVQVSVQSGASLWSAQLLNQSQVLWEHAAGQGEQTSYKSNWIELPMGNYSFTFKTIGVGSLNGQVTITSKGGFW
jgi:uncharacterized membrane protein